jgi:glycosyltransferase involved in cell wall biosynthesis
MNKISVIMPSLVMEYQNSATNRVEKLQRAINGFLQQDYYRKELVIVADHCYDTLRVLYNMNLVPVKDESGNLLNANVLDEVIPLAHGIKFIHCTNVPKRGFSGELRNIGIAAATGNLITYLDSDDAIDSLHLTEIAANFPVTTDWVYYNDYVAENANLSSLRERDNVLQQGRIGTSGITHKKSLPVFWKDGYGHDWDFVQQLMANSSNYTKIKTPGYVVCHIPGQIDF